MMLRRGKTRNILEGSIDSALLAVEIYNKPRTAFRTQAYISLMIIAWTRLMHAYFHGSIGERYFYKAKDSNRYELIDGEKKAWELKTCIIKYGLLTEAVKANLTLFIKLRNKIEHRNLDKKEADIILFGECQALLFNYEQILIHLFGQEFALGENLVFSLQFSALRTSEQQNSNKRIMSADFSEIKKYVETYRSNLTSDIFDSQEYSIKLIQIPKISNTSRHDLAIEFVHWNSLSVEDREAYKKLDTLVKDKIVKQPVVNMGGMKPSKVLKNVEIASGMKLTHNDHKCLLYIFSIKPDPTEEIDPFNTVPEYCIYDELHNDYIYFAPWVDKIIAVLAANKMKKHMWVSGCKQRRRYKLQDYI